MKIIKKFSPDEKDLKESTTPTKLMKDFPPILQERNPELLFKLVAESVKESGICLDAEASETIDDAPLKVRRKRTVTNAGSEINEAQTKKSKKDTSEASNPENSPAPIPKRKRGKGEVSSDVNQGKLAEAREERAKKMRAFKKKHESEDFVMTPEKAKEAQELADRMIAAKKMEKAALKVARDAKLKSLGLENCDEYFVQKIVEVKQIASSVEQQATEEAEKMLEQIPEAVASEDAPESASVAEALEAAAKVIQASDSPSTIPTPISPSDESDQDDIPIGQRMKKLHKPSPKPQQTISQLPLQEEQTSAAAECSEEPRTSDLPQCDSPLNLFSLERHLGGEITKTPQKATKTVPKKIALVT